MPGKINPTLSEMVIQIAHQVVGNDVAVSMATKRANVDLNVWDATFYKCLFESMQLVGDELVILRRDCVEGIVACEGSLPRRSRKLHRALARPRNHLRLPRGREGRPLLRRARRHREGGRPRLNEADADRLIDPILMTDPEAMARAIAEFRARIDG